MRDQERNWIFQLQKSAFTKTFCNFALACWIHVNYFKTEVCQPDDNPPIGIVLGARKDELLMEYALEGITNQLFVARYQLYLPKREELQAQLDKLLDEAE